jgi:hypothetical protein
MDQKFACAQFDDQCIAAKRIVDSGRGLNLATSWGDTYGPQIERCEALCTMLRLPYQAPSGGLQNSDLVPTLVKILDMENVPDRLKQEAESALQTIGSMHKKMLNGAAGELFRLIRKGGHDNLMFAFLGNGGNAMQRAPPRAR